MDYGYPSTADIATFLAGLGVETPAEFYENWYVSLRQMLWAMLQADRWACGLRVYAASATTINATSGYYCWDGTIETFTAGDAINPTDNDTTYVWLDADGDLASGIDGSGWPATAHIPLAEVDVDASGNITDVRDLRAKAFLHHARSHTGESAAVQANATGGLPVIFRATLEAGSTVQVHNANAPYKYRILDAWSVAKSADEGTWKLTDGTNDITDAVAVTAADKSIDRAGTIDDAYHEIAASGSLSVVGDGTLADVEVYIMAVRV